MKSYGNGITNIDTFIKTIEKPWKGMEVFDLNPQVGKPVGYVFAKGRWWELPKVQ